MTKDIKKKVNWTDETGALLFQQYKELDSDEYYYVEVTEKLGEIIKIQNFLLKKYNNYKNPDDRNNNDNDVAVIGIGLRFPSGNLKESIPKPNQLFNELLNGLDGIVSTSERWFDNYYLNGEIVSKFAGLLPLGEWKQFDPIFFAINPSKDNVSSIDPQQRLLLKCENLTIDTACSSSANAINCGYNSIKSNKSNVSIVGGVNFILDPHFKIIHTIRSFKSKSSNIDGNFDKLNFYSPSKSSQYENIKLAIKSTNGQINESDIDYCETHGTGTPTGDPIELEGISRVFNNKISTTNNNKQVLLGSIKSNIGHTEGKIIF
ncbi:hypothetical protein ACTFIY_001085 [Dictyostelium cf. discoideum]